MITWFDINTIAFEVIDYKVSYLELSGTFFGLLGVYWATRANILTWPAGLLNESLFFILFYQIGLYPDMFLQLYFFVVGLYGWYNWRRPETKIESSRYSLKIRLYLFAGILIGTFISGSLFNKIHLWFPQIFKTASSFPFVDSFIMVGSIVGTALLAKKKIENWILWIAIDVVATILYFAKGVYLLSLEFLFFTCLAVYGYSNWNKQLKQ